jgi:hypothetical protein
MDDNLRITYKNWLSTKLFDDGVNITFTVKQLVNGIGIDKLKLEKNFRYFRNMLNKKIFGNRFKRFGVELKMLVVREVSSLQRLHLHTIIQLPSHLSYDKFVYLIRLCWSKTLFGYGEIHIEKPSTQQREEGWFHYIMKKRSKIDFGDSIDLENSTCLKN